MLQIQSLFIACIVFGCALEQISAQSKIHIKASRPLSEQLNKTLDERFDELTPVFDPYSEMLYFTRSYHPQNIGGSSDPADIWRLDLGSGLSRPLADPLNNKGLTQLIGFAEKGQLMYLFQSHTSTSTETQISIAVARRRSSRWTQPEPIDIPYFWNKSKHQSAYVSPKGDVLLIAVESFGSHGNEDIYISHRDSDGKWSPLENLGNDLNTPYQERSPYLLPDQRSLVFATNGREGHGSWDLYLSHRIDDSWTNWSTPENLGTTVNSPGSETFFSAHLRDEKKLIGYFVSTQSSEGYANIWTFEGEWNKDTDFFVPTKKVSVAESEPQPVLNITALDQRSNSALEVGTRLIFRAVYQHLDTVLHLGANGEVALPLLPQRLYNLELIPTGFLPLTHALKTPTHGSIRLEFSFAPIQKGSRFLGEVYFVQGKDEFLEDPHDRLQKVVDLLRENPKISLFIAGHTDNQGNASSNLTLSRSRVKAVINYLTSQGVDPKRLSGKGYGATRPIASNRNKKDRAKNRRVEFIVQ